MNMPLPMLAAQDPALRILVVDDNRDAAMSLAIMLSIMGYVIHTVHDGEAAVAAAETFRPHVVLLDIGLPKMNGYEVARTIRQEAWGTAIHLIAVTGWGQDEDRARAAEAGMDLHLVKPIESVVLESLLASLDHRDANSHTA